LVRRNGPSQANEAQEDHTSRKLLKRATSPQQDAQKKTSVLSSAMKGGASAIEEGRALRKEGKGNGTRSSRRFLLGSGNKWPWNRVRS